MDDGYDAYCRYGDYPEDDYDEYEVDDLEMAIQECGQGQDDDFCSLAGTEHCDFECPFSDPMYKRLDRKAKRLEVV